MARAPKRKQAPARPEPLAARVFAHLADGRFHSGEELAKSLEVSRSAVWKAVGALKALGAELHAVRNRGYRLSVATEPLAAREIRSHLGPEARERVGELTTVWSIASTNTELLSRAGPGHGASEVLLAEHQSAGRGRRGRAWLAPPGAGVCLSLSWMFREVPTDLGALGLVVGVCAMRALQELGVRNARLKWPNDLLIEERKLGGVLIDLRAESGGPAYVVIGIGLNVALGSLVLRKIGATGLAATDLASAGHKCVSRNQLAALLVGNFLRGLAEFEREGLKAFLAEWRSADALRGRVVDVRAVEGVTTQGLARGIDAHGALMVETAQGLQRFISGDVSVRPAQ